MPLVKLRKSYVGGRVQMIRDIYRGRRADRNVLGSMRKVLLGRGRPSIYSNFYTASLTGGAAASREPSKGDVISQLDRAFSSWKMKSGKGIAPLR